jgi:hypothetical protein
MLVGSRPCQVIPIPIDHYYLSVETDGIVVELCPKAMTSTFNELPPKLPSFFLRLPLQSRAYGMPPHSRNGGRERSAMHSVPGLTLSTPRREFSWSPRQFRRNDMHIASQKAPSDKCPRFGYMEPSLSLMTKPRLPSPLRLLNGFLFVMTLSSRWRIREAKVTTLFSSKEKPAGCFSSRILASETWLQRFGGTNLTHQSL